MSPTSLDENGVKLSQSNQTIGNDFIRQMEQMFPDSGKVVKNEESTGIPFQGMIPGDLLYNPSSISISTFQRMLYTDDIIGMGFEYLSSLISCRLGEYEHPNKTITEDSRYMYGTYLEGGQKRLTDKMNTRMWAGCYLGQKIWRYDVEKGLMFLRKVRSLPPATVQFRVDRAGEVLKGKGNLGVLQYQFNYIPGVTQGLGPFGGAAGGFQRSTAISGKGDYFGEYGYGREGMGNYFNDPMASGGDADFPTRAFFIPPYIPVGMHYETFLHCIYDIGDNFDSPIGRSMFRKLYSLYVWKWAVIQLGMVALDRRSQPILVQYCDSQKTLIDPHTGEKYGAVEIGANIAPQIHSTSVVTYPSKKGEMFELEVIRSDGDLDIFNTQIQMINAMMRDTFGIPSSILSGGSDSGSGGSYASIMGTGSMLDKWLSDKVDEIDYDVLHQIQKPYLEYNYTDEEIQGTLGKFKRNSLTLDEQMKEAKIAEILKNINMVSDQKLEDVNRIREAGDYDKIDKCFEPLIDTPTSGTSTNTREARGVYKHEPMENR